MLALPKTSGTYLWTELVASEVLYVGTAQTLPWRSYTHCAPTERIGKALAASGSLLLTAWFLGDPERWELERRLWAVLSPRLNRTEPIPRRKVFNEWSERRRRLEGWIQPHEARARSLTH